MVENSLYERGHVIGIANVNKDEKRCLQSFLESVVGVVRDSSALKGSTQVKCTIEDDSMSFTYIYFPSHLLTRVLHNLLTNAARFTFEGEIELRCRACGPATEESGTLMQRISFSVR